MHTPTGLSLVQQVGFFLIPNSEPCVVKNVKSCHKILGTDKLQQMAQTMDGETYGENKTQY